MNQCKRGTVHAIGITDRGELITATNYNESECTGEVGKCGCIHVEVALLRKKYAEHITTVITSLSPCKACAEVLVAYGVDQVLYMDEYRIRDGIVLLEDAGIKCTHLGAMRYVMPQGISKRLHLYTRNRNEHGHVVTIDQVDYGKQTATEALELIRKEMIAGNDVQATWEYRHE